MTPSDSDAATDSSSVEQDQAPDRGPVESPARAASDQATATQSPEDVTPHTGIQRLEFLLPAISNYLPGTYEDGDGDKCNACNDGECGGICPSALYIVRQVIEALEYESPDDLDYILEEVGLTQEGFHPNFNEMVLNAFRDIDGRQS